jgi:FkbM family methyltransferase
LTLKGVFIEKYLPVEPNFNNFQALNFNIFPRNGLIPKAVWTNNQGIRFSTTNFSNANSINPGGDIFVPTITLKELVDQIDNDELTILKIDIEGAEYEILKNSLDSLNNIKIIFVEFHNISSENELMIFIRKNLSNFNYIYEKKSSDMYILTGISK